MMTLKAARESNNITKVKMCRELGISRPTYDIYEKDPYSNMTVAQFRKACKVIGVDTTEIFFDKNGK